MSTDAVDPGDGSAARPSLLLVEDDRRLGPLLAELLGEAYEVRLVRDGQAGLHALLTAGADVAVVDRGLPGADGLDMVVRARRAGVETPVLVLTARGTVQDRVEGLDAGAEDYLVKPFEVDELLARLRALLRRHGDGAALLRVPGGRLDVAGRAVHRTQGGTVDLTARESALLELLARRPSRAWSREEVLERVFDRDDVPNTVDTYVHYLRRKLGTGVVVTVRGIGYRLGAT